MVMVYDVFTYNGETDILDLRLNMLDPYVDKFILFESTKTFTGKRKPLYFIRDRGLFKKWEHKIQYSVNSGRYSDDEIYLAYNSPNTQGANHWKREFLQKERIKIPLQNLKDSDIVYISDVDEIWDPLQRAKNTPQRLNLRVYAYYLDNRSSERFWGILRGSWGDIKTHCLNHLRTTAPEGEQYGGWHFTSMGGVKEVRRKLDDSYTEASYNTPEVQKELSKRVREGTDYLGRDFTFKIDESEWPQYLKDNRSTYAHLCKGTL